MEYTIDKNVPIPPARNKFPFRKMAVGASFLLPEFKINQIQSAAYAYGKRNHKTFTCRTVDGGVRVWRIA